MFIYCKLISFFNLDPIDQIIALRIYGSFRYWATEKSNIDGLFFYFFRSSTSEEDGEENYDVVDNSG